MKKLELNQMENLEGGLSECLTNRLAGSAGIATGLIIAGALTGGIGFAVAGLLFAWGGSVASVVSC